MTAIVALMVLATLAGEGVTAHSSSGAATNQASSTVPSLYSASAGPSSVSLASNGKGACHSESESGVSSTAPSPISGTTGPSPLYNSQVQPYAVLTGPYGYVAAGAALRDQGYGLINLTWPGAPSTGNLVAAYLVWAIMNDSVPPATGTLNGVNISGTWTAYATPSPCWSATYIYTFVADVTGIVVNGINNLTNFPSGITNGQNPWGQSEVDPSDEGASLVAVYTNASSSPPIQQVTVYTGAYTTEGQTLTAQLNYSTTNAVAAKTTYIMEDGQLPGNVAVWNGTVIDPDAFPGSDPKESTAAWSYGNLSDTKTFNVNVTLGSNNTTAEMYPTESDCLTWIGQVLSVGVPASPGPYPVDFQEQGLPNGVEWNVTTGGKTHSGTVADFSSTIAFSLGNGSYTYSVGPIPGYTAPYTGDYRVDGGPVYIRVLFHQLLYPITFNETGLPESTVWWVYLTNVSQDLADNVSAYAPSGISFDQANGTYNFTAGDDGLYTTDLANGSFTVDGASVSVTIPFVPPPLFNVTFAEQGLPSGTEWDASVYTNFGVYYPPETTNRSFSLMLPNASSYADYLYPAHIAGYSVADVLYFGVFGVPETVDVNYSILYDVNLTETGLPVGTFWDAALTGISGELSGGSTTSTVTFSAPNGTYTFSVIPVWGYTAIPATGTVTVAGANVSVPIVFTLSPTYPVTFYETGLAAGTSWSVEVYLPNDTEPIQSSTNTSLSFSEPNGSYFFDVLSVTGFEANPSSGDVVVDGANASQTITFSRLYSVTFTESGLPSGTDWYLYFAASYEYSTSPSIVFYDLNGTYPFEAYTIDTYTPSPDSGSLTVNGANITQAINYTSTSAPTFTVTFTESGLPTETNWSVALNGYPESSTGTSLNFTEPNGSYDFTVGGVAGYNSTPSTGTLVVSGEAVNEPIAFAPVTGTFSVTFSEKGLPSGLTWTVTVNGTTEHLTTDGGTDTLVWTGLTNATYAYTITGILGWHQSTLSYTGSVVVNGASVTEPTLVYSSLTYSVTFSESGLPAGLTWTVTVNGLAEHLTTDGGTDTLTWTGLVNGSYAYSITDISGWHQTTLSYRGGVVVSGASVTEPTLVYSPVTYTATFTESGLPNGVTWYVNITGQGSLSATVSGSTGTQLTISLANGSFSYSASSNSKAWSAKDGSFSVSGSAENLMVPFTSAGGSSGASGATTAFPWLWAGVGGGVAILLALLLLLFVLARRRKKKEQQHGSTTDPSSSPPEKSP